MAALQSAAKEAQDEAAGNKDATQETKTTQLPATDEEKAMSAASNFQAALPVEADPQPALASAPAPKKEPKT